MNTYAYRLLIVGGILCIGLVAVGAFFASYGDRFTRDVITAEPIPAAEETKKSSPLDPKISSENLVCELRPEDEKGESRRVSYSIQSKDVNKTAKMLMDLAASIPNADLASNHSSYDSSMPGQMYTSASLNGTVPVDKVDAFVAVIEKLRTDGVVFVESTNDYAETAQNVYQNCLSQLTAIQSLELKEAILLKQLEGASLAPEVLDQVAQSLTNIRMEYSYMVNSSGPSVFDILGRINATFLDIYITNMRG